MAWLTNAYGVCAFGIAETYRLIAKIPRLGLVNPLFPGGGGGGGGGEAGCYLLFVSPINNKYYHH